MRAFFAKSAGFLALPLLALACGLDDGIVVQSGSSKDAGGNTIDGSPIGSDGGTSDGGSGGDGGTTDAGPKPGPLVFASSGTALYSLDVTNLILKQRGTFSGCKDLVSDIAVDGAGNIVAITPSGSDKYVAQLSATGACSAAAKADSQHTLSIGYFGATASTLLELRDDSKDLEQLDPVTGSDNSLNGSAFPGNGIGDITCSATVCYALQTHDKCAPDPGLGSYCLFSIDSAGNNRTQIGALAVPVLLSGLAYNGGNLYGFSLTSPTIYQITLSGPNATPLTLDPSSDNAPAAWLGAGSSSAY